jgi:hypothetical protein
LPGQGVQRVFLAVLVFDHHLDARDLFQIGIDFHFRREPDVDPPMVGDPLPGQNHFLEERAALLEHLLFEQGSRLVVEPPEDGEDDEADDEEHSGKVFADESGACGQCDVPGPGILDHVPLRRGGSARTRQGKRYPVRPR